MTVFRSFLIKLIIPALLLSSCGKSIKDAQDFEPNESPVISDVSVTCLTAPAPADNKLWPGIRYRVVVTASDPESAPLSYIFSSESGSFSGQTDTATGCAVDFIVGTITGSDEVGFTITATDLEGASAARVQPVGSGKVPPTLTLKSVKSNSISPDGFTEASFSADCEGDYEIFCDNDADYSNVRMTGKGLSSYGSENAEIPVTIGGTGFTGNAKVKLASNSGSNRIWVLFRDKLGQVVKGKWEVTSDGNLPRVVNAGPASSSAVTVRPFVTFNRAIDPMTVTEANFLVESGGSAVTGTVTYDAASYTATFIPASDLTHNASYSVRIKGGISGIKDTIGNRMSSDYAYAFTTNPAGVLGVAQAVPSGGTYNAPVSVRLYAETGATVWYTTNGSDPSNAASARTEYSSAISVLSGMTIKTYVEKSGSVSSAVKTETYGIRTSVPAFSSASGTFFTDGAAGNTVTISAATGNVVWYSVNGGSFTSAGGETASIPVTRNTSVSAYCVKSGMTISDTVSASYNLRCAAPVIDVDNGSAVSPLKVFLSSATKGSIIRYEYSVTTDGSAPSALSPSDISDIYGDPLQFTQTYMKVAVKAYASKDGFSDSVTSASGIISKNIAKLTAPVLYPSNGAVCDYDAWVSADYGSSTEGSPILRYTTNGTEPVITSPAWTAGESRNFTSATTVKIKAFPPSGSSADPSDTAVCTYQIRKHYLFVSIPDSEKIVRYRITRDGFLDNAHNILLGGSYPTTMVMNNADSMIYITDDTDILRVNPDMSGSDVVMSQPSAFSSITATGSTVFASSAGKLLSIAGLTDTTAHTIGMIRSLGNDIAANETFGLKLSRSLTFTNGVPTSIQIYGIDSCNGLNSTKYVTFSYAMSGIGVNNIGMTPTSNITACGSDTVFASGSSVLTNNGFNFSTGSSGTISQISGTLNGTKIICSDNQKKFFISTSALTSPMTNYFTGYTLTVYNSGFYTKSIDSVCYAPDGSNYAYGFTESDSSGNYGHYIRLNNSTVIGSGSAGGRFTNIAMSNSAEYIYATAKYIASEYPFGIPELGDRETLLRYKKNGASYVTTSLTPAGAGADYIAVACTPSGDKLVVITADTVYVSDDFGDTWISRSVDGNGAAYSGLTCCSISPSGAYIAAADSKQTTFYETRYLVRYANISTSPGSYSVNYRNFIEQPASMYAAILSSNKFLYVGVQSPSNNKGIRIFNSSLAETGYIGLATQSSGSDTLFSQAGNIAVTPDNKYLYYTVTGLYNPTTGNTTSTKGLFGGTINPSTGEITSPSGTWYQPDGVPSDIAVSSDSKFIFTANDTNSVTVFAIQPGTVIPVKLYTIPTGSEPNSLLVRSVIE